MLVNTSSYRVGMPCYLAHLLWRSSPSCSSQAFGLLDRDEPYLCLPQSLHFPPLPALPHHPGVPSFAHHGHRGAVREQTGNWSCGWDVAGLELENGVRKEEEGGGRRLVVIGFLCACTDRYEYMFRIF
jgi:hypothetical protein